MIEKILVMLTPLMGYVPRFILALLVFVVGWLVCKCISKFMAALLKKAKIDERLNKKTEDRPVKIEPVISKFVYYILLVYVLLLTLDLLGVKNVLDPLEAMFGEFVIMIPNIVGAVFIAFLGYVLAKTVSSIVRAASAGLDPLAPKAGLGKSFSISKVMEQVVFIVIFVVVITASLRVLKIESISKPAENILNELAAAVPNIIGAAIVIFVSYITGRFVANFVSDLLKNLGADDIPKKIGAAGVFGEKSFSKFCGGVAFFFIMLSAAMVGVGYLNMPDLTEILTKLLEFSGNVVLGLIILGVGNIIANFAYDKLAKTSKSNILPLVAKIAILGLIITMGLHTMEIGKEIIELAFMFTLGTLSLTIILAFGLGGREAAGKQMGEWLGKLKK